MIVTCRPTPSPASATQAEDLYDNADAATPGSPTVQDLYDNADAAAGTTSDPVQDLYDNADAAVGVQTDDGDTGSLPEADLYDNKDAGAPPSEQKAPITSQPLPPIPDEAVDYAEIGDCEPDYAMAEDLKPAPANPAPGAAGKSMSAFLT